MIMTLSFMEKMIDKERRAFLNEEQTPEKKYKLCALDYKGLLVTRNFAEDRGEDALESARRYWLKYSEQTDKPFYVSALALGSRIS